MIFCTIQKASAYWQIVPTKARHVEPPLATVLLIVLCATPILL